MNYDEEYWRAKAVEAQNVAAQYYAHAMIARNHETSAARAWQAEAYDVHQKALARLGWAEVERNNVRGRLSVMMLEHNPHSRPTVEDYRRWTLDRRNKS